MASYYTIEDVQQIRTIDGQHYQLLMSDVNNGEQYFTYTTQQNSDTPVLQQQQIFVEGQLQQGSLDQSQNVYYFKTDDNNLSTEEYKAEFIHEIGSNEVLTVSENNIKEPITRIINGQQIQLINVPTNTTKQLTMKNPPPRSIPLKKRMNHVVIDDDSGSSNKKYPSTPIPIQKQKQKQAMQQQQSILPSAINRSTNTVAPSTYRLKSLVSTSVPSKLQTSLTKTLTPAMKPPTPSPRLPIHQNTPPVVPCNSDAHALACLSERLKQNKATKVMQQPQPQPQKAQSYLQKKTPVQSVYINSSPEKQEQLINLDKSDTESIPDLSDKSVNSDNSYNEIEGTNNTESYAYLQKAIDNPQTTIVQHQIEGNTVKMLVVMPNGEQRLITFDIPNEECTVNDLLEQAGIPFNGSTTVSLVKDPILKINYIVESEAGTIVDSTETDDANDELSNDDNVLFDKKYLPDDYEDNNIHATSTVNIEEPKYIDGKLAVCGNCGLTSMDFNRCYRCKKKIQDNPKTTPYACQPGQKKDMMASIDKFYKGLGNNDKNIHDDGLSRSRVRQKIQKTTKLIKEPECLTLSSDDEDTNDHDKKIKKIDIKKKYTTRDNLINHELDVISEKEPIITNTVTKNDDEFIETADINYDNQQIETELSNMEDDSILKLNASLMCRTVRIGSYKYIPKDYIIINTSGLTLSVPLLEDETDTVKIHVKFQDIVKVLIHFAKSMPVLFFYTNTISGSKIREILGMQDTKGPYYDPAGKDQTHKRITLLPESLNEESKIILKQLFSINNLLDELTTKEANDILIRASPKDPSNSSSNINKRQSTIGNNNLNDVENMTVYPAPPAKGGITITTDDYSCLAEDQFLNDVIIDFYLKYITLELLSVHDQQRTHVFSSYFYKRLTSPHAHTGDSKKLLSPAAKRHARVSKWTKNVNIFDKDFIIIPINEHSHWFLAIICFPGLVGVVKPEVTTTITTTTTTTTATPGTSLLKTNDDKINKNKKVKEHKLQSVTIGSTTITPVTTTITLDQPDDGSERDEAEGDDEELDMESDDDEEVVNDASGGSVGNNDNGDNNSVDTKKNNSDDKIINNNEDNEDVKIKEENIKIPCILIFDSLAGAGRSRVVATLRDYLSCEYTAKIGGEKVFTKDTIKGACPKVPQQSNFTDCGLYVLQYVESFFKNPIINYTMRIKTLKNWFDEIIVTRKREDLSKLLVKLMRKTNGDKMIDVPILQFPTIDGILKPRPEKIEEKKEDGKRKNEDKYTEREPGEISPRSMQTYTIVACTSTGDSSAMEIDIQKSQTGSTITTPNTISFSKTKRHSRMPSTDHNNENGPIKKFKNETT